MSCSASGCSLWRCALERERARSSRLCPCLRQLILCHMAALRRLLSCSCRRVYLGPFWRRVCAWYYPEALGRDQKQPSRCVLLSGAQHFRCLSPPPPACRTLLPAVFCYHLKTSGTGVPSDGTESEMCPLLSSCGFACGRCVLPVHITLGSKGSIRCDGPVRRSRRR